MAGFGGFQWTPPSAPSSFSFPSSNNNNNNNNNNPTWTAFQQQQQQSEQPQQPAPQTNSWMGNNNNNNGSWSSSWNQPVSSPATTNNKGPFHWLTPTAKLESREQGFTFMMNETSGRVSSQAVARPHVGIFCDACRRDIDTGIRLMCLDCSDYDLCETCERDREKRLHHFSGLHMFAKIHNTTALGGNEAVNKYKRHQ